MSYRNQSIDLVSKSMDWFLYDRDVRHKRDIVWCPQNGQTHVNVNLCLIILCTPAVKELKSDFSNDTLIVD